MFGPLGCGKKSLKINLMTDPLKDRRRSRREPVQIPVVLRGVDASGRDFFDRAELVSIDEHGARVRTRFLLSVGAEFQVQFPRENTAKRVRVVWQGEHGSVLGGIVGIELVDPSEGWNAEALRARWGARGS